IAQAMGPIGGWLAVTGSWSWEAVVLGLAVGIWIGGFDLIYACQDVDADREIGVRSVPARFGVPAAIRGARACHVVTTALFAWYAVLTGAGLFFWLGLLIVAGAFVYEHTIVRPHDLTRLNRAFFSVNGFIGIALFVGARLDLLVRGLTPWRAPAVPPGPGRRADGGVRRRSPARAPAGAGTGTPRPHPPADL